mmetsp:Transcript_26809/g.39414  ORF Transcript_26809/g.39414 Transcript_26809/m.39414 type:complete len:254 (-) Transcript_26809:32-793(-)
MLAAAMLVGSGRCSPSLDSTPRTASTCSSGRHSRRRWCVSTAALAVATATKAVVAASSAGCAARGAGDRNKKSTARKSPFGSAALRSMRSHSPSCAAASAAIHRNTFSRRPAACTSSACASCHCCTPTCSTSSTAPPRSTASSARPPPPPLPPPPPSCVCRTFPPAELRRAAAAGADGHDNCNIHVATACSCCALVLSPSPPCSFLEAPPPSVSQRTGVRRRISSRTSVEVSTPPLPISRPGCNMTSDRRQDK